jgi:hypothetical protein
VTERNFSEDVKVSKLTLDSNAENQAELQLFYGNQVAEAKESYDEAEGRLELLMADKEMYYRQNPPSEPGKFEKDGATPIYMKLTESIVKALVTKDPDVQKAQKAVYAANRNLNEWKAAERAIEQRKSMIETLAKLHGASYFATPRQGSDDASLRGFRGYTPSDAL